MYVGGFRECAGPSIGKSGGAVETKINSRSAGKSEHHQQTTQRKGKKCWLLGAMNDVHLNGSSYAPRTHIMRYSISTACILFDATSKTKSKFAGIRYLSLSARHRSCVLMAGAVILLANSRAASPFLGLSRFPCACFSPQTIQCEPHN